ncbi:hypothetical protein LINGRAHAP2_LOCUS22815 [Linum grandiflorum]
MFDTQNGAVHPQLNESLIKDLSIPLQSVRKSTVHIPFCFVIFLFSSPSSTEPLRLRFGTLEKTLSLQVPMASYLLRKYADYLYTKWERTILWDMIDHPSSKHLCCCLLHWRRWGCHH